MKEFSKIVHICQSYYQTSSGRRYRWGNAAESTNLKIIRLYYQHFKEDSVKVRLPVRVQTVKTTLKYSVKFWIRNSKQMVMLTNGVLAQAVVAAIRVNTVRSISTRVDQ